MSQTLVFVAVAVALLIHVHRDIVAASGDADGTISSEGPRQYLQNSKYEEEETDVIFRVNDYEFPAHKAALAAASEVLHDTFSTNPEAKKVTVTLQDISEASVGHFLSYMYSGNLPGHYSTDTIIELLTLAGHYKVTDIEKIFAKRVAKMSYEDALKVLSMGFKKPEVSEVVLSHAALILLATPDEDLNNNKAWCDFELELPDVAETLSITKKSMADFGDADDTSSSAGENPFLQNSKYVTEEVPRDVCLHVNDKEVYAHKAVLTEASEVFRVIFTTNPEIKKLPVNLENIPETSFDDFLECMYTGKLPDHESPDAARIVMDLLALAERYKVKGIEEICADRVSRLLHDDAVMVLSLGFKKPKVSQKVLSEAASVILYSPHDDVNNIKAWRDFELELPDVAKTLRIIELALF